MDDGIASDGSTPSRIFLAGNPNSGKTTLFNALTGLRYKVANYPGVTVERREGKLALPEIELSLIDLPGIYSLHGSSPEEQIAAKSLTEEGADKAFVLAVLDATNLERNLFLLTELIDLKLPMVVALSFSDEASQKGIEIKEALLSNQLDLPVVKISAKKKQGLHELTSALGSAIRTGRSSSRAFAWRSQAEPTGSHDDPYSIEASQRYAWINSVVKKTVTTSNASQARFSDTIDHFVMHPIWGYLIFLLIMALLFNSIFAWATLPMDLIDSAVGGLSKWVSGVMPGGEIRNLLVDGIIPGVGSVIVFVPQIALLFFFIGLLEDSGYLCRAAFLMDRLMRKVGLQGRSFIPLLSSFACAVPGIMSTRTIPSLSDRLTTIMVAPLMSCSARIPVYTVLIAAFIPQHYLLGFLSLQGGVLFLMYLLGIVAAGVIALITKRFLLKGEPAFFVMEMPPFRAPSIRLILRQVYDRVAVFIKSAGTVILACSVVLWFLAAHPKGDGDFSIQNSYAGRIGAAMEPVIKPLGYNWELGVGLLASFAAREVFVSSLATVYNVENDEDDGAKSLISTLKDRRAAGKGFGLATALSLMVFYVFACQCMSTLAVCRRETGSWKWPALMFVYMTSLAYVAALITFRISSMYLG